MSVVLAKSISNNFNDYVVGNARLYRYQFLLGDDISYALPLVISSAFGSIIVGDNEEWADFIIDSTGTVFLKSNTEHIIANTDSDLFFCLGFNITQNPLYLKNRLGLEKNIMLSLFI